MKPQDILDAYGSHGWAPGWPQASAEEIKDVAFQCLARGPEDGEQHIWATGLGKSALVAQKLVGTAQSLGRRAQFIHPVDGLHGDVGAMSAMDVLVAISASGNTEETVNFAYEAKKRDLLVIAITSSGDSRLALAARRTLWSAAPSSDPGHIPTTSFASACAVADALAVALAGDYARVDHPGGEIGRQLRS